MICVIATIEVKPGTHEAFLAEFHKNMPNVHAEKGRIEYGFV
jgi:quinol monooxygenase YgiN